MWLQAALVDCGYHPTQTLLHSLRNNYKIPMEVNMPIRIFIYYNYFTSHFNIFVLENRGEVIVFFALIEDIV